MCRVDLGATKRLWPVSAGTSPWVVVKATLEELAEFPDEETESYTLPETNSSQIKMDGWKTFSFPFGMSYFHLFSGAFAVRDPGVYINASSHRSSEIYRLTGSQQLRWRHQPNIPGNQKKRESSKNTSLKTNMEPENGPLEK